MNQELPANSTRSRRPLKPPPQIAGKDVFLGMMAAAMFFVLFWDRDDTNWLLFLLGVPLFPTGILGLITNTATWQTFGPESRKGFYIALLPLVYLAYVLLLFFFRSSPKGKRFWIGFAVLLTLLAFNVVGCHQMVKGKGLNPPSFHGPE